ncbi:hypothetical protein ATK78_4575 [Pedobacter metabolipauper]|uniref:Uncharacterized protein n=2 Tax=Pedobacter metabolipauper TaxID=425513 RepID=A0A4R6SQ55_9SPHI|nr:hypothetical protein ATK78_4575 [Pedobacter metabolipauper]
MTFSTPDQLIIIPFVGTERYLLGSPFDKIKENLATDIQIIENKKGKRIIDGPVSLKFKDDKLLEFSILDTANVLFDGHDVFSNTFKAFLTGKYASVYKYGFLIFAEIGIALNGYTEKEEQKTITVFQKGNWDEIINL